MAKQMSVLREMYPVCWWHTNCEKVPSGGVVSADRETSIVECHACGDKGVFPVGKNCATIDVINEMPLEISEEGL